MVSLFFFWLFSRFPFLFFGDEGEGCDHRRPRRGAARAGLGRAGPPRGKGHHGQGPPRAQGPCQEGARGRASRSKCKGLREKGTWRCQTEQGGVCIPGKREERGGKPGKHGKHGEYGKPGKHGKHGKHGEHGHHGPPKHKQHGDHAGEERYEMGDEEPSMLQVDPRLEAEMNATDGQWTGEDFDPREWFGDEPDRHHGGRHHRMMQRVHIVLTHLLTGVAHVARSRFCPSCGRCCCCKKKPTRVADVVPAMSSLFLQRRHRQKARPEVLARA